ncbi:FAD-dependent oxidoreductase [Parablastomonas sp. CN1-191]|uniref:FAD-dependent oxidoreductase n=1 Tax=Parablastomonas sp. CN1-191 TaxID=3400908 RepID=UPI003BF8F88F
MESLAGNLSEMQRTPLREDHVARLRQAGRERHFPAGTIVAEAGDLQDRFIYVVDGTIEVLDPVTRQPFLPSNIGPAQFMGDIGLLAGGVFSLPYQATTEVHAIEVDREPMLALMRELPEMSDIVITVLAARLRRLFESDGASLALLGHDDDLAIMAVARFADRNRIPYRLLDPASADARAVARKAGIAENEPAVVWGERAIPGADAYAVAEKLGMALAIGEDETFDVLIVGGGPAGVAAAVYAGAEGLSALVVEDAAIGGQAGTSSRIENYLGFPTGISGGDLVWRGEVQAMKFGTRFAIPARATEIEKRADGTFCVALDRGQRVCVRAVVVASGVQYRRLPIEGLAELEGVGVYYAATDMEARFCEGTEVAIIGGGNSAGQAAMYLSRRASCVHLLVRGTSLAASMSEYLASRLASNPAVTIHYQVECRELIGRQRLDGIRVTTPEGTSELPVKALFVMVGAAPNTRWLGDCIALDDKGFVRTGRDAGGGSAFESSVPGVFAVGDVRAGSVKRVASAVGEGSVTISEVWKHVHADREGGEA